MFRELVDLGRHLDASGELPPPGFYDYTEPIRWIIHLFPTEVLIEATEMKASRPFSGRTSAPEAHLLSDEASYSLSVRKMRDGREDKRADEKHRRFRALYRQFLDSDLVDASLRDAIELLDFCLENGFAARNRRFDEITSKDWVTFVPEVGPLTGQSLFQQAAARTFWLAKMRLRCSQSDDGKMPAISGNCAVCGAFTSQLVRKLPLGVKIAGTVPLHSINESAFASFVDGPDPQAKTHLGVCFDCGDIAARAFNSLSNSDRHRRAIVRDRQKRDGLGNQTAFFWLKTPVPVQMNDVTLDLSTFEELDLAAAIDSAPVATQTDLSQLLALLKQPWQPTDSAFRLDDFGFFLAVLSPNVGRIALREWIAISLASLKSYLSRFLDLSRMVSSAGTPPEPVSIRMMLEAIGTGNPNLTRGLLRTAYTGAPPPGTLAIQAGHRLNELLPREHKLMERQRTLGRDRTPVWGERWPQALAAAIRLSLFFGSPMEDDMEQVNPLYQSQAYHCGRLLATLEEAQQIYHFKRNGNRLDTTIVDRSYGGASSAPSLTFGSLIRLATVSHLPDAGGWINKEVEAIVSTLAGLGGFPQTLSAHQQAEFGLGFYHERAAMRGRWASEDDRPVADSSLE